MSKKEYTITTRTAEVTVQPSCARLFTHTVTVVDITDLDDAEAKLVATEAAWESINCGEVEIVDGEHACVIHDSRGVLWCAEWDERKKEHIIEAIDCSHGNQVINLVLGEIVEKWRVNL